MQCLRRQPQQKRSRERVALILDTAAEMLSEVGASSTSITAVAKRANLAPSTIYEWVHGDRELIGAVAERGLDSIHRDLIETLGQPVSSAAAIDAVRDGLHLFLNRYRNETGLRQALAFMESDPVLTLVNLEDTRRNAAAVEAVLAPFHPGVDLAPRILLITNLAGSLAALIAQHSLDESAVLVAEFEAMITAALSLDA